jgi:hypothetical protein
VTTRPIALAGAALLALTAGAAPDPPKADAGATRIFVGPNILVSRDGDVAHCETMVASNPRDAKNLVGTSITLTRPDGGSTNKVYATADGGASWTDAGFDEGAQGGGDPQIAFGATGTAIFAGISFDLGIYTSRSEDGGKTWSKPLPVGRGDHEMLAVDQTTGPYSGRVYITEETDQKGGSKEIEDLVMRRRVVLFRSADDARSWTGPVEVAAGDGRGIAAENLAILSDGTLFIPMISYPNYAKEKDADSWDVVFAASSDGGVTFSPKKPIGRIRFGGVKVLREHQKSGRIDQMGGPTFAVDASDRFKDRIYCVYVELDDARYRLMITRSSDRGATWSAPKPVDPSLPAGASEFQQMIAVNPDGALGVFYYSTPGQPDRQHFDTYFTASVDGGDTFLPKARVSSQTSYPFGGGNLRPGPTVRTDRGMTVLYTTSGLSRWPDGGDYIGMTAGADGAFHPFWADGRSGTYQLYSAAIRVGGDAPKRPDGLEKASLTDRVTLVFDPIQYDQGTREVRLPARLKNTSKETLYPPFQVEVKELIHPYTAKSGEPGNVPKIVNASNGKTGIGAVFDYSKALGDLGALAPDAVSDAVVWRLEAPSPVKTDFYVASEITGYVAGRPEPKKEAGTK